jgi:hypothetical protein
MEGKMVDVTYTDGSTDTGTVIEKIKQCIDEADHKTLERIANEEFDLDVTYKGEGLWKPKED